MGPDERVLHEGVGRQGLVEEVGVEEPIALVLEGVREAEGLVQLRPQEGVGPDPRLDHEEPGRAPRVPVDQRLASASASAVASRCERRGERGIGMARAREGEGGAGAGVSGEERGGVDRAKKLF